MWRIILVMCLINSALIGSFEFGDRIEAPQESEKAIRNSQELDASPNADIQERSINLSGGTVLSDGDKISYPNDDSVTSGGNKPSPESPPNHTPFGEFIDIGSDSIATPSRRKSEGQKIRNRRVEGKMEGSVEIVPVYNKSQIRNFRVSPPPPRPGHNPKSPHLNPIYSKPNHDMQSSSSSIELQEWTDKDKVPSDRSEESPPSVGKPVKVATSYVDFRLKTKEPIAQTQNNQPSPKPKFVRIKENSQENEINADNAKDPISDDKARTEGDRNQSVTNSNKSSKSLREKVTYVEVKRGTKNKMKHDKPGETGSTPEPTEAPVTSHTTSFDYFSKKIKTKYVTNPERRTTPGPEGKSSPNFANNSELKNPIENSEFGVFYSNFNFEPNSKILPSMSKPPSENQSGYSSPFSSNPFSNDKLMPEQQPRPQKQRQTTLRLSDYHRGNVHVRRPSLPPAKVFSKESGVKSFNKDKVYNDILDSTKSIIQKAELQFHKKERVSLPNELQIIDKYNFIQKGEGGQIPFAFDSASLGSSPSISETMVLPPPFFFSSSGTIPKFTLSPTKNLYREDVGTNEVDDAEKLWHLRRPHLASEEDSEPASSAVSAKLTAPANSIQSDKSSHGFKNHYVDFSDIINDFTVGKNEFIGHSTEDLKTSSTSLSQAISLNQDNAEATRANDATSSEAGESSKSTEFLYDRPNNFHTSFEDYLETHGIHDSRFGKVIPKAKLKGNKKENYEKPDFSVHSVENTQDPYLSSETEPATFIPIPYFRTTDDDNHGDYNDYEEDNKHGNRVTGILLKNAADNLKPKEPPKAKVPGNDLEGSNTQPLTTIKAINLDTSGNFGNSGNSGNFGQIQSSVVDDGSFEQQHKSLSQLSQNSFSNSQDSQQPSYPLGSPIGPASKFNVNPPVLNTLQKRPPNFRPRPMNRAPLSSMMPSFMNLPQLMSRPQFREFRGRENRPQFHTRLALSKYLQPPPPPPQLPLPPTQESETENGSTENHAKRATTSAFTVLPGNLTGQYTSNSLPPMFTTIHLPSNQAHNVNSNEYSPISNFNHVASELQLSNSISQNVFANPSEQNQNNKPQIQSNSLYNPSISSHVRGNTPSYQQSFLQTSPNIPTPSPPLRPPFYPTKPPPPHQQMFNLLPRRYRPKYFFNNNIQQHIPSPSKVSSRYRFPPPFRPQSQAFGRHHMDRPQVQNKSTENQSSHFKVIQDKPKSNSGGLSGKSNSNSHSAQRPSQQATPQFDHQPAHRQQVLAPSQFDHQPAHRPQEQAPSQFDYKPVHRPQRHPPSQLSYQPSPRDTQPQQNPNGGKTPKSLDNLIFSESVQIPIATSLDSKNTQNVQKPSGSQPLPKELMRKREHKVPESHRSMLRSLKYGVHGEPLDVWIPIKSHEDNQ